MTISELPTPPSRSDSPADFVSKADPFIASLPQFRSEANALAAAMSAIAAGTAIGIPYTFSTTTTDSDPGPGVLRLDNATQNTATTIRADLVGSEGSTWTSVLDTFDDSTSTVRGQIRLSKVNDGTKWLIFNVTALATPSGYRNITVTCIGSSAASPFANGDDILLAFTRNGDIGSAEAGKESIFIAASAMVPNTTGGCAALATVETSSNKRMFKTLDFDPASSEKAQFYLRMPKRWDAGTLTASIIWLGSPVLEANSSSYANTYGSGDRSASITVTAVGTISGSLSAWVDGSSADATYPNGWGGAAGDYIRFQFPTARVIDEITITHEPQASFPFPGCIWQGSNDGSTWTTLTTGLFASHVLGGSSTSVSIPVAAGGPFLYYRLYGDGAVGAGGYYIREITFKISASLADTTAQAVKWNVSAVAVSDGEDPDVATGTAQSVTDVVGTAGTLRITSETAAITVGSSPASRDAVWITVIRDAADGTDTMTSDARLLGIEINYTATALNDN